MIEFEKPTLAVAELSDTEDYGKFIVEPLERGFGNTLGNSMRRILLSSLPGVAVTNVKIDGVVHEFSTIPGVKEDVTEIILNLKSLIAKLFCNEPKKVVISAKGPCVVTAANIEHDSDVTIINPDLHIATLNKDAKLYMEITLSKGHGYVSAERNKKLMPHQILGVISVDSIYTPVVKVNYTVENTRVGQITDYDKLTLEIWTNGVLTAPQAASLAATILTDHIMLFSDLYDDFPDEDEEIVENSSPTIEQDPQNMTNEQLLNLTLDELNFSVRSYNCLKRVGVNTLADLVNKTEDDIRKIRNLGAKSIDEVLNKLKSFGYVLPKLED